MSYSRGTHHIMCAGIRLCGVCRSCMGHGLWQESDGEMVQLGAMLKAQLRAVVVQQLGEALYDARHSLVSRTLGR